MNSLKQYLLWPFFAIVILFTIFSIAREALVPFNADFERARWCLTGDEPAYLLTAQAIASGHGEDVSRVHAAKTYTNFQNKIIIGEKQWNYDDYVNRCKVKFLFDRRSFWGDAQIQHGSPLTPLFAAPFALSKNRMRWKIIFAQGVFLSIVAAIIILITPKNIQSGPLSLAVCVAFMASAPIVWYSTQIFPEILIGSFLALSLLLVRKNETFFRITGYVLLFLSLFGSSRIFVGIMLVAFIYLYRSVRNKRYIDVVTILIGFIIYFGYNICLWGNFFPPNTDLNSPITLSLMPIGLLRYFFGNSVGLLFLAPVAWVGIVTLILLLRHPLRDSAILPCAVLTIGISFSVATFPAFRAGTCPAGRYQVAVAFVLIIPVLLFLGLEPIKSAWRRRVLFMLATMGILSALMGVWLATKPSWWFRKYHPAFGNLRIQPYYNFLPDFSGSWYRELIFWIFIFIFLTFLVDIIIIIYRYAIKKVLSKEDKLLSK